MTRNYMINVPQGVENEEAYIRAAEARIDANRRKGARTRWFARHADAERLSNWLFSCGEFDSHLQLDPRCSINEEDGLPDHRFEVDGKDYQCSCKRIPHPLSFYSKGAFLDSMRNAIDEWGGLTDGQHVAVRKSFQRAQENSRERATRRLAKIEEERATSQHVGTVGERREFTLICEKQYSFDGMYGATYINICRDESGNVVVYKGSNALTENMTVVIIATVKAHEHRDGVAQTIIARPKIK